jgi:hypothetical protein
VRWRAALLFFLWILCGAKKNECAALKRWQAATKYQEGGSAERVCADGSVRMKKS